MLDFFYFFLFSCTWRFTGLAQRDVHQYPLWPMHVRVRRDGDLGFCFLAVYYSYKRVN